MVRAPLLLAALATVTGCGGASPRLSQDDVAALRTATDRYVQTALAADWDAWATLLAADAVFLPPNGAPIEGRRAIRDYVTAFTGMASFTSTLSEVVGQGDLAVTRGSFALAMGPDAAIQLADTGKFLTVWHREPGGEWLIRRNIWNSNRPVVTAPLPTGGPAPRQAADAAR